MSSSSTAIASSTDHSFFSHSKYASSGSTTVVTTRVVAVPCSLDSRAGAPTLKVTAQPSPLSTTARDIDLTLKRKSEEPLGHKNAKKRRVSPPLETTGEPCHTRASSRISHRNQSRSSRQSSLAPSLLSLDRGNTPSTRATSVVSVAFVPAPRECWIDENGNPGPGSLSSEVVVQNLMKGYKAYFRNPLDADDQSFEPHPIDYPSAMLEYPNTGASERFILLAPKDKDHYNPIMCLESTLHTIIETYLTPTQASLFGKLPSKDVTDEDDSEAEGPSPVIDAPSPPYSQISSALSSPCSDTSSLSSPPHPSFSFSCSSISSPSSLSSISALSSFAKQTSPSSPPSVDYLRLLQRAIKTQDGPFFLKVLDAINTLLSLLKYPPLPLDPFDPLPRNELCGAVRSWTSMPSAVVQRIVEETYQRAVGPHIDMLKRYEAFSSEVYGELMPAFVSDILHATGVCEDTLFLDLGSGVGNVVLQASLETGCRSFGVEIMPGPAEISRSQLKQFQTRCKMWGVRMGQVELEEGDMLKSARVDELVKQADVVLVNNKVFLEPLNEALRQKFLDLKEGAVVVSLKCLMGSGRSTARHSRERSASPALKERNLDDIGEIFTVTSRAYKPGCVSWGGGGGEYFLQRMNREDYARRKLQFEHSRAGSARVTRSRR